MKKEMRTVYYDEDLKIEAYRFEGITQPFPSHFHEYYVVGIIENGERSMLCNDIQYNLASGSILLLNPGDTHSCVQSDGGFFDYRAFNIQSDIMNCYAEEITGNDNSVCFMQNVINDKALFHSLRELHEMLMNENDALEKEEIFSISLAQIIEEYGGVCESEERKHNADAEKICEYINTHYAEHITLNELCQISALSKTTLIRSFTKAKGITPYRYLENIRLNEAKKLLERGVTPIDAAAKTGFSDQSHFTNFFKDYIGLTPKQYRDIFR